MPLDTSIARSVKPLKIQFRDLGADYNQLAQMQSAESQNQLAQMQMQEARQMAPLRMQEQQTKAASAKLTLDRTVEARDFITKTMKAAEENSGGTAPKDPLGVIKVFLGHPSKEVQDVGTNMANAYQLIQDFEADQRYATAKGGLGGAPAGVAAAPPMAAAVPAAPPEMFTTKDSSGRPRYVVNGVEVSPQEYQSAQSGVVVGAAPAARLNAFPLPAPVNALAAAPTANVNAMAAPVAKTAADIKAEIDNGDLQFGRSKRWAKERELLVDQYKEALKPGRADSTFAAINPSDYTPDSVKAFVVSKNYGDLVPKAGKADSPISNVNPNDFTPASVQKFALSRNYGDLVLKPVDRVAKDDPTTTAAFSQVDAAGNVTFYNKFGNPISTQKGAGKPSATFEKTTAQRKQLSNDLTTAINELTDITKDGGLIDQSTGSGAGRLVDLAAGFGGIATPGAIAIGKLQPVADLVLKMVPRFEGPQSNADTTSYKQAAAQLADPTLPAAIRKEAGKTVLRLMIKRKGQFVTQSMADEGMVPSGGGAPAANVDALLDKYK